MKNSITLVVVFVIATSFTIQAPKEKCKSPDLIAVEIQTPDWDHDDQQTIVNVIVKNVGNKTSKACRALLFDLDISVEQAKSMDLDELYIEMIAENNGRASYFTGDAAMFVDENKFDYDRDFAEFVAIPQLEPGKKK